MSESPRSLYRLEAGHGSATSAQPVEASIRPVQATDDEALGRLMERAYSGTVDEDLGDNSDGAVEIADWRASGAFGTASYVAVDDKDLPLAASLITKSAAGAVWLSYVFTDPGSKGQGLGTATVAASLKALVETGRTEVLAGVTDGNAASERLLGTLGFVRIGPT